MRIFRIVVVILLIVSWSAFFVVDYQLAEVIRDAVRERQGMYGEMYGPLSYFRQVFLVASAALSLIAAGLLIFGRSDSGKNRE